MLDAFTSGVAPDGLKSKEDIKIFICYLLNSVPRQLSAELVTGVMLSGAIANYYEIKSATEELIENKIVFKNSDGTLSLSDNGKTIAKTLYSTLPSTVRTRAMNSAMLLISRLVNEEENKAEIVPCGSGYTVKCSVMDGELSLLNLDIYAPDKENASRIADSFLEAPQQLYKVMLAFLIGDEAVFGKPQAIKIEMSDLPENFDVEQ